MSENFHAKLFEHNIWANDQIIQACSILSDELLDKEPQSVTKGSLRRTLTHLVSSQLGYLNLLTKPVETRRHTTIDYTELQKSAKESGEGLLALTEGKSEIFSETRLQTTDGYYVEPWVVLVQAINHATEHREQIKSMLSSLGNTPPDIDGWIYGGVTGALVPIFKESE